MKSRRSSLPDIPQKKPEKALKHAACERVWVNPKSPLKKRCERAWGPAEVHAPKFIDMDQIDLRAKKPERAKAAAAGESPTSAKSTGT